MVCAGSIASKVAGRGQISDKHQHYGHAEFPDGAAPSSSFSRKPVVGMVCQNQSIDESDADLARDLRILVRQRLVAGDSDQQVMDYIVSRYGEFVLLKPRFSLRNALLWGTPVVLLLAGGLFIVLGARSRRAAPASTLTVEEQAALDKMLRD